MKTRGLYQDFGSVILNKISLKNYETKKQNITNENIQFNNKQEAINYLKNYIIQVGADESNSVDKDIFGFLNEYEKIENVIVYDKEKDVVEIDNIEKQEDDDKNSKLSGIIKSIRKELNVRKALKQIKAEEITNKHVQKKAENKFKLDTTSPDFIINSFIQQLNNIENKSERHEDLPIYSITKDGFEK